MDYETYEKECSKIKAKDKKLLNIFEGDLLDTNGWDSLLSK